MHALDDSSDVHLLEEMAVEVAALSAHRGRPLTLIAESDLNDPRLVTPREAGGYGLDAQWSDDFHHAVHVALTGETDGYYADFEPLAALAKVCEQGFFHDGTYSSFRGARPRRPDRHRPRCPPGGWWSCSQNHDQIGNRAVGDRLTETLDDDQLACAALLDAGRAVHADAVPGRGVGGLDAVPVLHLAPRARAGQGDRRGPDRRSSSGWAGTRPSCPDPQDPATFQRSKLDWAELGDRPARAGCSTSTGDWPSCAGALPELTDPSFGRDACTVDEDARLFTMRRGDLQVVGQLRRRRGDRRGGRHRCCTSAPVPRCRWTAHCSLPPHAGALRRAGLTSVGTRDLPQRSTLLALGTERAALLPQELRGGTSSDLAAPARRGRHDRSRRRAR